jgi:hypothetical protein
VKLIARAQLHQTAAHKEALKAAGMETLAYDGMGEMHVKSLDDWIKFSSTPFFTEKMVRKYSQLFRPVKSCS